MEPDISCKGKFEERDGKRLLGVGEDWVNVYRFRTASVHACSNCWRFL